LAAGQRDDLAERQEAERARLPERRDVDGHTAKRRSGPGEPGDGVPFGVPLVHRLATLHVDDPSALASFDPGGRIRRWMTFGRSTKPRTTTRWSTSGSRGSGRKGASRAPS